MRRCITLQAIIGLLMVCATAHATDFIADWKQIILDGSLSSGGSAIISGTIPFGNDRVVNVTADFIFPNATVGDGSGQAIGSLIIEYEVRADKRGPAIHDLTVDLIGNIVKGQFAKNPFIAWSELVKDISNPNNPTVLVSDSGVEFSQPSSRHYIFATTYAIRIKETYILDGVTYVDEAGRTQIDSSAIASLAHIEKELSFVPEPGQIAGLGTAFLTLAALGLRRGRRSS
jgi:hypothetical protein